MWKLCVLTIGNGLFGFTKNEHNLYGCA
ncbi:MAG: hypothetical protein RL275_2126, partial [Chloroflexota bacterium]